MKGWGPVVLLAAGSAHAATWTVTPDGTGDFPTIQAAIDAAAAGDEIVLADGTFTGPGNREVDFLGKAIAVRSASGNREACVIDCEDADLTAFRFLSGESPSSVLADLTIRRSITGFGALLVADSWPVIRNVVVRDGGVPAVRVHRGGPALTGCLFESNLGATSSAQGIVAVSDSDAAVEDCTFRSNGAGGSWSDACLLVRGGDTTIRGCAVEGNGDGAITVLPLIGAYGALIEDCTIQGNHWGIVLHGVGSSTFAVQGCDIVSNGYRGIQASGSGSLTVEGCRIEGNYAGVTSELGVAAVVRDCRILANTHDGLSLRDNPTVEACTIRGNAGVGFYVVDFSEAVVRDCLITGNLTGIAAHLGTSLLVERSTIAANDRNVSTWGGGLSVTAVPIADVRTSIVWGNCLSSTGWEVRAASGTALGLDCVTVDPALVGGGGEVTFTDVLDADPLFCDPLDCAAAPTTAGLYALSADSPALAQPCGPMGAPLPLCEAVGAGTTLGISSWGAIKARYR